MTLLAREEYLVTEVMTATPQKLQLMLIEGAIKFAERARKYWETQQEELAADALIRCQCIVTELVAGLNNAKGTELGSQMGAIYLFIFRRFVDAQRERSEQKLNDAIKVLLEERETWRQVCEKLGAKIPAPHISLDGSRSSLSLEI